MPKQGLMVAVLAVLAAALVAAGCGSDDSSTTSTDAATTTSTDAATTTTDATDTTTTESTTTDSGSVDAEGVYNACIDAISGTAAEATAKPLCEQVRTAFEGCAKQAESTNDSGARESLLSACQKAAEQATAALESAG